MYLQLLSNLWKEFPSKRKREFFFFLGAMFLASCSEVISIGAVIPFLTILTTPDTLISINDFFGIFQLFDFINKENSNLMITIVFCIASTIACITRLYLLRLQINLSFNAGADIANKIFINSLDRPYSYHIYTNSNEIISGILTKSDTIIFHIILPCLTLISSITISIFIVAFLVSISPTLTFTIFVVFVFVYGAIAFITKSKLKANSLLTSKYNTLLLKILQESFRGIRELFLYNAKDIFLASFKDSDRVFRSAQASTSFISQSPKYLMEASGVILIASIAYFLTKSNNGDEVSTFALPILGSIALAAQRLLPLFQHIYAANSYLRGYKSSLVDVLDLLKIRASAIKVVNSSIIIKAQNTLSFESVTFSHGKKEILENINLQVCTGDIVGIYGETGAGKSTFLDIIAGLLEPSKGFIKFNGHVISSENLEEYRNQISFASQSIFLLDSSIYENVAFGYAFNAINKKLVEESLKSSNIANHISQMPNGYLTKIGENGVTLSGGQRQRIALARAFYRQAKIRIYDEPTSAQDYENEQKILNSIYENKKDSITFIVSHKVSTLNRCNKIIEIKNKNLNIRSN